MTKLDLYKLKDFMDDYISMLKESWIPQEMDATNLHARTEKEAERLRGLLADEVRDLKIDYLFIHGTAEFCPILYVMDEVSITDSRFPVPKRTGSVGYVAHFTDEQYHLFMKTHSVIMVAKPVSTEAGDFDFYFKI